MIGQYAFYFDSSACSGCKACQAACKDRHNLPAGLLWRRVYEVTGGSWARSGPAWINDVFAYNLSISCNHCQRPVCVEVCPTRAMHQRADGIVVVDQDKCMGCQYCQWACPYDAPQYDAARGRMTKCDFCVDNLEVGLPPACVAACPMRALDVGELRGLRAQHGAASDALPLPDDHFTGPALLIKPHGAVGRAALLGNAEETGPQGEVHFKERSLVAFTLLSQMAIGTSWLLSALNEFSVTSLIILTALMLIALAASVLHLGSPLNAWRAVGGWRSSWLSREVLCAALFTALLGGLTLLAGAQIDLGVMAWLTGLCGLALLISMTRTYRLRTIPEWNQWPVTATFFITTLLLGALLCGMLMGSRPWLGVFAIGLLGAQQAIGRRRLSPASTQADRRQDLTAALRLLAVSALAINLIMSSLWIAWPTSFLLTLSSEVLARLLFYKMRKPRSVWRFAAHSTLSPTVG